MVKQVLSLFGRAPTYKVDFSNYAEANETSLEFGYILHPDVCTLEVLQWVQDQKVIFNSGFYTCWDQVISKSRFELLIDQLLHYASTYGTDFTGPIFIENVEPKDPRVKKLKAILPISIEELGNKIRTMLYSGIALKSETITTLIEIIDYYEIEVIVNDVKNREAKMHMYKALNQLPADPEEMVRFLVFMLTDETMIIKNKEMFDKIRNSKVDAAILIKEYGVDKLSSVFYRFKPLFLAMKNGYLNHNKVINALRRAARTNHTPMKAPFVTTILSNKDRTIRDLDDFVDGINNFKKVQLLQTINVRARNLDFRPFVIRNQKLYIKEGTAPNHYWYPEVYKIIYDSLIASLRKKRCNVKFPEIVELTFPTSEKSFVGNLPLGSRFKMGDKNAIIGIHWYGKDGADDLDLSYTDLNETKIGWNSDYYTGNKDIVYSGDVTSAEPEASELLLARKGFVPGIIKVNLYRGDIGSKFRMFVAMEEIEDLQMNHMVNPDNIIFSEEFTMDQREISLGVVANNEFMVAMFKTGQGMVSGKSITNKYTDYIVKTNDCYLNMKTVLKDAGFVIDGSLPFNIEIDMDFSELDKSSLIELLA